MWIVVIIFSLVILVENWIALCIWGGDKEKGETEETVDERTHVVYYLEINISAAKYVCL